MRCYVDFLFNSIPSCLPHHFSTFNTPLSWGGDRYARHPPNHFFASFFSLYPSLVRPSHRFPLGFLPSLPFILHRVRPRGTLSWLAFVPLGQSLYRAAAPLLPTTGDDVRRILILHTTVATSVVSLHSVCATDAASKQPIRQRLLGRQLRIRRPHGAAL